MIRNYLKTALRTLLRQKSYSIINIGGLAIGMSVCILILTYVFHELSFDRFHEKSDQIYRLGIDANVGGNQMNLAVSAAPMGPALVKDYPEAIAATRLLKSGQNYLLEIGEKKFYQTNILHADSSFFHVFSYKLLRGNKDEVLKSFKSVVLSEKVAQKFFGNDNPLGKTIKVNGQDNYTVTGVMENVPGNSHIQFEIIFAMGIEDPKSPFNRNNNWGSISLYTYLLFEKNTDIEAFHDKFPEFQERYMADLKQLDVVFNPFLQPLTDIHLLSDLDYEIDTSGDITYVYLFSAVAIFILVIACINYMNLASARSFRRAKEVGLRKVHGALRGSLIKQFIGESILFSSIAFVISIAILQVVLFEFNDFINAGGNVLVYNNFENILIFFVIITTVVGVLAGSYPAFYMSSFSPIAALKGDKIKGKRKSVLRNSLVVLQFTIAVALIICTGVIYSQLTYIKNKDLGFDLENRIVISLPNEYLRSQIEVLKNDFDQLSLVENVSRANGVPAISINGSGFLPEGLDQNSPVIIYNYGIDDNYIDALDIEIVEGRNFSKEFGTDTAAVIINERLCKIMNWDDPIGKKINTVGSRELHFNVIGVTKDFHFKSLLNEVEPFMFFYAPRTDDFLVVEFKKGFFNDALKQLKVKWAELTNNAPFDYIDIKKEYEEQYDSYLLMGKLFTIFTLIAIFVACIGLFGLASFLTEMRTKEIGIRKVNGASVFSILRLLNIDFLKWVLIANAIAWPIAWYFMTEWLNKFSYQIELSWYYFVFGALMSVLVALITVSYQSIKSAVRNPVDSLRYE